MERTDRHFKNSSLNDIIIYLKIFEKHSQCLTEIVNFKYYKRLQYYKNFSESEENQAEHDTDYNIIRKLN